MTESPEENRAGETAADPAAGPAEVAEVAEVAEAAAWAEKVARANEQLRDGFAKARDGFEQLKSQLQSANGLATTSEDLLAEFKKTADTLTAGRQELEREKAALVTRERAVAQAEHERDQGYADERSALDQELAQRRQSALSALEAEMVNLRTTRLAEVAEAENAERERVRSEIAKERSAWDEIRTRQQQQQDELERQKGAVSALQSELEGRRVELDGNELDLEARSDRLMRQAQRRSENLDDELARRIAEERQSFESSLQAAVAECERLRGSIQSQAELLGAFEHLQQQLGGRDPGVVIVELNTLSHEIKRQAEELATRPTKEMLSRFDVLESENHSLRNRIDELAHQLQQKEALAAQSSDLKLRNSNLEAENKSLEQKAKIFAAAAEQAEAELTRLRASYKPAAEIEARRKEIELPAIKAADITPPARKQVDELEWLDGIAKACDSYGLHFNPRILKAFHTSLKTAEWSPLTVLAGVSGTGKSELPRLYSHFGGLFFQPLAVQPNWDSQESMLGFFNSIDNRFDAQPVLRFLAQSQKPWANKTHDSEGYPGLAKAMCLVLLDEMNLAHPELYFAEFLSKLELRRGMKGSDVPSLPVKIGAGMEPYQLPLGRNVLWTGTMNQDETTKSLSDKVLDRSIIIHFPRPTDLKRRLKLAPLDEKNRGASLHKVSWQNWLVQGSGFTDEEVKPYKKFIEDMNASLAVAGRAIGHRVWQSVEYYMANYPDVRAAGDGSTAKAQAMHVAFEDQLVQKVMPKLRGIDTRGKSKDECLDKIRGQLVAGIGGNGFNLAEDFDLATELGYGQFIWQSANYLKVEDFDESA
ncbi:MAG TPA: hypothetical protein VMC83_30335 [Streptosporangiaceae bacterium]|nr:hypothetical protein [Streptosporangiaceae bacterium]